MIPENPVVGGTVLRRAAIQSPNFATGVAGWSVNQDGSAEFNNLVIRNGQIISGSALFYSSSPPAAGTLIASVAAASGTDSKGNAYLQGAATYFAGPPTALAMAMQGDTLQMWTAATQAGPYTPRGSMFGDASGNLNLSSGPGAQVLITSGAGTAVSGALSAGTAVISGTLSAGATTVSGGLTTDTETITSAHTANNAMLEITNTASSATPVIRATINAAGDLIFGGRVTGDTNSRIVMDITAGGVPRIRFGSGSAAPDAFITRPAVGVVAINVADLDINTVGRGLQIAEGANARMGTATLVAGVVTVANTTITANTRIFLSVQSVGGTQGLLRVSNRVVGTSFQVSSANAADTSTFAWLLLEPG